MLYIVGSRTHNSILQSNINMMKATFNLPFALSNDTVENVTSVDYLKSKTIICIAIFLFCF